MQSDETCHMSKARDLINAHLYPVLATFAVIYGAIQIAPIAQQARDMNTCVKQEASELKDEPHAEATYRAVLLCNGGVW